jgi:hypothetical protein
VDVDSQDAKAILTVQDERLDIAVVPLLGENKASPNRRSRYVH